MEPEITPEGTSELDHVAVSFADELERLAQASAAGQGQPVGTRKTSDAEAVKHWGITDPNVEYDQILQQLQTTGLPPEMLDPEKGLLLFREQPDLAQWYGQPVQDPALADRMARIAEHPFRMGLLMDIDDPDEQVREANRLDRAWTAQILASNTPAMPSAQGVEPAQQPLASAAPTPPALDAGPTTPTEMTPAAAPSPLPLPIGG